MINEYELYSDEKYLKVQKYTVLGGLICTDTGRERLLMNLERVRRRHNKWGEMKWEKIKSTLDFEAYKDWANVFFEDPYARYVLFSIKSDMTFVNFYRQKRRKVSQEEGREAIKAAYKDAYKEGLSSAYHQFLLVSFGKLHDTKRWTVYPDDGLLSKEIIEKTKTHFNRTYKFPKSSNNIRFMEPRLSKEDDLLQLTDLLLGAFSHDYLNVSVDGTKGDILKHCKGTIQQESFTKRNLPKLVFKNWVPEGQYNYAHNFKMARSASWTQSYH